MDKNPSLVIIKCTAAGSNELECIQQRTSAIHEEMSAMTPKMADHFSTLRRELKDVQRSITEMQKRLSIPQTDAEFESQSRVDIDRRRSLRDGRRQQDAGNGRGSSAEGVATRLVEARGRCPVKPQIAVSDRSADSPDRCQNSSDQPPTAVDNTATGEDAVAVYTLCL